jgi:predicted O-methyltransferase YrrM
MKYIYVLVNNDYKYDIKLDNNNSNNNNYNNTNFLEYNDIIKELKIKKNSNKNILYKEQKTNIFKDNTDDNFGRKIFFKMFGIDTYNYLYINNVLNLNDIKINSKNKVKNIILRYGDILYNNLIKNATENEKEIILQKSLVISIYNLFDLLELGGNFIFSIHNFSNKNSINIIYLLSNFFEKIVFIGGMLIFCINYKFFNININKQTIEKIFKNKCIFTIEPKKDEKNLIEYLNEIFKIYIKKYKLLLFNKEENFLLFWYSFLKNLFLESGIFTNDNLIDLNLLFIDRFRIKINDDKNLKSIKITSAIKNKEGSYISEIISKNNYKKCLEIGLANGISAVYILKNKSTNLISIDPFQKTQWKNEGKKLLKKFKLNNRHKCIEKKSYEALPELLKKYGNESFDFIFIDGWHTFDYTLVDFFYSNFLLKIDGIIIIDDVLHPGVSDCITYLNKNYKFYNKLLSPNTIACYKKIKNDDRDWNFHVKI